MIKDNIAIKMAENLKDKASVDALLKNSSSIVAAHIKIEPSEELAFKLIKKGSAEVVENLASLSTSAKFLDTLARKDKRKGVLSEVCINAHLDYETYHFLFLKGISERNGNWLLNYLFQTKSVTNIVKLLEETDFSQFNEDTVVELASRLANSNYVKTSDKIFDKITDPFKDERSVTYLSSGLKRLQPTGITSGEVSLNQVLSSLKKISDYVKFSEKNHDPYDVKRILSNLDDSAADFSKVVADEILNNSELIDLALSSKLEIFNRSVLAHSTEKENFQEDKYLKYFSEKVIWSILSDNRFNRRNLITVNSKLAAIIVNVLPHSSIENTGYLNFSCDTESAEILVNSKAQSVRQRAYYFIKNRDLQAKTLKEHLEEVITVPFNTRGSEWNIEELLNSYDFDEETIDALTAKVSINYSLASSEIRLRALHQGNSADFVGSSLTSDEINHLISLIEEASDPHVRGRFAEEAGYALLYNSSITSNEKALLLKYCSDRTVRSWCVSLRDSSEVNEVVSLLIENEDNVALTKIGEALSLMLRDYRAKEYLASLNVKSFREIPFIWSDAPEVLYPYALDALNEALIDSPDLWETALNLLTYWQGSINELCDAVSKV